MANFGHDIPIDRPDPGSRAAVFVARADADEAVRDALKNGSGMAGFLNRDATITIYFENNKFNDPALFKWESKVFKAYDRMVEGMPTVNKLTCDAYNLLQVGLVAGPEILVLNMDALTEWLKRTGTIDAAPASAAIHA